MNSVTDYPGVTTDLLIDALEALSEGIAIYDADERLVICNSRHKELLEPLGAMIKPGMRWGDLVQACVDLGMVTEPNEHGEDWVAKSASLRGSFTQKLELPNSTRRTFQVSYHPTKTGGFVVTRSDVTERRIAEDMTRDRDALLTTILSTNPTPVIMSRLEDSRIVYRSPAAFDMYGDTNHAADYFIEPNGRESYVAKLREAGQVQDERHRVRAADGSERIVSLSGGLTDYNGESHVVSSVTDVTEQLEREALIRKVVESCPAPVLMNRAATGEILFKSPELNALFGDADDARSFYVNAADREAFVSALRKSGQVVEHRSRFYNRDGDPIWAAVSARIIQWEGEEVIVSHARDLTNQLAIEDELSRQQEQIFQNEKMSALGNLLAGVAHELNNPLSIVVGHAMMLQDEAKDAETKRQVAKISNAAERCAKIVKTFLTMARQEPVAMDKTDVNEVVSTAVEVARFGDNSGTVAIEADLDRSILPICVDADQITQVIINLILNAEQAIRSSGRGDRIKIRTEAGSSEREVRISVEDNGPGIPTEVRARIFDPFFTTKGVGEGTGIGLAVCHRIVSAHDGVIAVEDVSPHGARFVVTLSCNQREVEPVEQVAESASESTSARILIIDDERDVADLNSEILERGGFSTRVAYKADDAFAILRSESFDAVISDLNMPGIDGRGLFDFIRGNFPELLGHTGFITGDTLGKSSQTFLRESARPYLEKPVSPGELRTFVTGLCRKENQK